MISCPACRSANMEQARNDAGHFRSPSRKPFRVYQHHCLDCGHIAVFAEDAKDRKPAELLGPQELTPIGGDVE